MRNKPLLLGVSLFCFLATQANAQVPICRGLMRVFPTTFELALERRAPSIFPAIHELTEQQLPRPLNEIQPLATTFQQPQRLLIQNRNPFERLLNRLLGGVHPIIIPPIEPRLRIDLPPPNYQLNDGVFRSPGSPFPPIGDNNGSFYIFVEDDEDFPGVHVFHEPPIIYQATNNNDEETLDDLPEPENSPLQGSLEQLLRLIQFSLGHYTHGNNAAPPIIEALTEIEVDLLPNTPAFTLEYLTEDILQAWRQMVDEEAESQSPIQIESLIDSLFNTLLTAFNTPAMPLEDPNLERAERFVLMLTEGAEIHTHNLPDPVILAHLIFELEALVRQDAITFEQLVSILERLYNREEAAFLAYGHDLEEQAIMGELNDRDLTEATLYAFLEARANMLLLHLVDRAKLQSNLANLHHNLQQHLEGILSNTAPTSTHSGNAIVRILRSLIKAQYRFKVLCLTFWDSRLARDSIVWASWESIPCPHGDAKSLLFLMDLYRIHQGLRPTTPSKNQSR